MSLPRLNPVEPPWYGPVCPVVGEGWHREVPPYPDHRTNTDMRVHRTYGAKIVEVRYSPPGLAVPLAIKDLRLALAEAERAAVPMPTASLVNDRLVGMATWGWADLDWSALGLLAAVDAGLANRS